MILVGALEVVVEVFVVVVVIEFIDKAQSFFVVVICGAGVLN